MVFILLGFFLLLVGAIILARRFAPLTYVKTATGTVVAYERNANGEFHPIVRFGYMTFKYFFKNANTYKYPRLTLGSEQVVYFDTVTSPPVPGAPLKATLGYSAKNTLLPWILIGLGILSIEIFAQITRSLFFFLFFLVGLVLVYTYAKANQMFGDFFNDPANPDVHSYPMSETFEETAFNEMKFQDLTALRQGREKWLNQQKRQGSTFLGLAVFCFLLSAFLPSYPIPVRVKIAAPLKILTAEQVIDAGSPEEAEKQYGAKDTIHNDYCILAASDSCFFFHLALNPKDTEKLIESVVQIIVFDIGLIFLLCGLISFNADRIFNRHDVVELVR